MEGNIELKLSYAGKDVDDGTMSIEDMIPVLQGFTSVYSRIVDYKEFKSKHVLRLIGIEKGSCDFIISAIQFAQDHPEITMPLIVEASKEIEVVLNTIKGLIDLISFLKKKPYEKIKIGDIYGELKLVLGDNTELTVAKEVVELSEEKGVRKNLARMAQPIEKGRIDSGKMVSKTKEGKTIESEITYETKEYFEVEEKEVITSKEMWIEGKINMLRKSTNKGELFLTNGNKVTFEMKMENPETYYHFFSFKGPVKMQGIAHFGESLEPIRLEVFDIQKLQREIL